jgi:hypothetical protein
LNHDEFLVGTSNGLIKMLNVHHGHNTLDIPICKTAIHRYIFNFSTRIVSISSNHIISYSLDGMLNLVRLDQL